MGQNLGAVFLLYTSKDFPSPPGKGGGGEFERRIERGMRGNVFVTSFFFFFLEARILGEI